MFKWKKLGPVFNPADFRDRSWMFEFAQAPSVLVLDDAVRVFFSTRAEPDAKGQYVSRFAYIDLDKNDLLRVKGVCDGPILPLGGLGEFDEFGTYPVSTVKYGEEVRAYYGGLTRCESVPFNSSLGLATSYDNGATFTRFGPGPVLSHSPDEPFILGSPKARRFGDKWYLWYVSGRKWVMHSARPEPIYKIRMAQSDDGVNWTKIGRDLIESVLEEDECQASADVFRFGDQYHMLFSYRYTLDFKTPGRGYRTGHACSDDLINWTRLGDNGGLETSASGWDAESVSYPHVFELDKQIYMLYQGNQIGRFGFGLAKLEDYRG